jgi:uncharacterized DUF497 family protein
MDGLGTLRLPVAVIVDTITCANHVRSDQASQDLAERGLEFADAALIFGGVTIEVEDTRMAYGEKRIICYGLLAGRVVVVGYTPWSGSSRLQHEEGQ